MTSRNVRYFGRMLRGEFLRLVPQEVRLQGSNCGKNNMESPRTKRSQYPRERFQYNATELVNDAENKRCRALVISDTRGCIGLCTMGFVATWTRSGRRRFTPMIADVVPTGWFVRTSAARRRSRVISVCPKQIKMVFSHDSVSAGDRVVAFRITRFARTDYLHTLFASG